MTMKKCSRCGNLVVDPDVRFCETCGLVLVDPDLPTAKREYRFPWIVVFVIFIVIFLYIAIRAAFLIPNYSKANRTNRMSRVKQHEASTMLIMIHSAERDYFETEGRYSTDLDEIGYEPIPTLYDCYKFKIISADEEGFVARAWANIDDDKEIDVWEVTDKERWPVCIYNDVTNEGEEIELPEIEEIDPLDKQSEAREILIDIYYAEIAYYATESEFRTDQKEIGFAPRSEPRYYKFKIIHADENGFTARAWANIDNDEEIDVWEVTEKEMMPVCIYDDIENEGEKVELTELEEPETSEEAKIDASDIAKVDIPKTEGLDILKSEEFDPLDKQSEARAILVGIFEAEDRYITENRIFSEDFDKLGFKLASKPKYYQFKVIHADRQDFIARAWGNIDDDDKIDVWEVTDKDRRPFCIYSDIKNSGEDIDPLERLEPYLLKKQSEAREILEDIFYAEIAYYATEATFNHYFSKIGYTFPSKPKYYQFKIVRANEDGFVARAWGNLDRDDEIDIWEVTDKDRKPVCINNDVKNEGKNVDPLKVRETKPEKTDMAELTEDKAVSPSHKQLEASKILRDIFKAEISYYKKKARYSTDFNEIGLKLPSKPKYYRFKIVHADEYSFIVRAWGNIDDDTEIDIYEVTSKSGMPVCIYNDITNRGKETDPLDFKIIYPWKVKKFDFKKSEDYDPFYKQSEARAILIEIYDAELRFFTRIRKFSDDFDELGFELASKPKYYQFEIIHADEHSFEVRAWGNIDKDGKIDIWMVNDEVRTPCCVYNDLKNEGESISPLRRW